MRKIAKSNQRAVKIHAPVPFLFRTHNKQLLTQGWVTVLYTCITQVDLACNQKSDEAWNLQCYTDTGNPVYTVLLATVDLTGSHHTT